jgi:hypothetical protein
MREPGQDKAEQRGEGMAAHVAGIELFWHWGARAMKWALL